jgi:hypothetical protein
MSDDEGGDVSPQVRPHALFASPPPPLSRETTLSSSGYVRSACPACLLLRIVGDDCVCVCDDVRA